MGIKLIAKDTIAPWDSKVVPPVTRGLQAWFTFDTDAARFSLNRAIGKPNADVVGAPVAYATHGRFKGLANYLKTQVPETAEMTIVAVGRLVSLPTGSANGAMLVSNFSGNAVTPGYTGTATGVSLYSDGANFKGTGCRDNGSGGMDTATATDATDTPTDWAIRAVRTQPSAINKYFNLTKGTSATNASVRARVLSDSMFRIGSATGNFAGEADISAVAIYSVALTDDEIRQVADAMRKRMTRLGISV
ncbi:hypothetical protein ACJ70E_15795 [Pseudomonas plecoglossicida]|uniref:hypothetical protein n=1 Tax=Pseudomonas plecoglossicida TaxID=70775 RepID=UPI003977461F